jgi:hypothetical protein
MIRSLRQRHRVMLITLATIVPTGFAAGLLSRREIPIQATIGAELTARAAPEVEVWARNDLWSGYNLDTRLVRTGDVPSRFAIEISSKSQIVRPDVLVYWAPREVPVQGGVPDEAILLGKFDSVHPLPLPLPEEAVRLTGVVILYSLADQEIVATSKTFVAR